MASMQSIPFDEIVAGGSAQQAMIEDIQYISVRDTIMHCGGQTRKTANKTWEKMSPDLKEEVANELRLFQFPGQGKKPEAVISFKGALKLVMWISGANARKYRATMVEILSRYYAGDG